MQGADQNYAPPKAHVADVEPIHLPMPREVGIAVFSLYAAIVLIVVGHLAGSKHSWPPYFGYGLGVATPLWALIPYFVSKGSRAARVVLLVVVLLAMLATALNLVLHVYGPTISRPLAWASLILRVIAVCLVYTKPANAWFKRRI